MSVDQGKAHARDFDHFAAIVSRREDSLNCIVEVVVMRKFSLFLANSHRTAVLIAAAFGGGVMWESNVVSQDGSTAVNRVQDQRYLVYVKGIT